MVGGSPKLCVTSPWGSTSRNSDEQREIEKDPVTDPGKKSNRGLMQLNWRDNQFVTIDRCTWDQERSGLLRTVFKDGQVLNAETFWQIRERAEKFRERC